MLARPPPEEDVFSARQSVFVRTHFSQANAVIQAVLSEAALLSGTTRFSLTMHMIAEKRSIALNSDCTVAVIRATVTGLTTDSNFEAVEGVGHCFWQILDICVPGSISRRSPPASSSVGPYWLGIDVSGCDAEPTFLLTVPLTLQELSKNESRCLAVPWSSRSVGCSIRGVQEDLINGDNPQERQRCCGRLRRRAELNFRISYQCKFSEKS